MRAAILDNLGELPRLGEFHEPEAQPGESIVRVSAAAIKPIDRAIAAGTHYSSPKALPVVCGMDGVGRLDDGSRVYFSSFRRPFGAIAERAPAPWTVPVPEALSDIQAAAVVNPALAAWLPLVWRGRMQPGETVLILGATGAAGRFAVRAARLLGAGRVVAAGRRREILDALEADSVIDLTLPEDQLAGAFAAEARQGIGVVLDYLWGRPAELLIQSLAKSDLGGAEHAGPIRFVSIGEMAGRKVELPSAALRASWLEIMGSGTANFPPAEKMQGMIADILAHAASGALALDVEAYPLEEVSAAWAAASETDARPVVLIG